MMAAVDRAPAQAGTHVHVARGRADDVPPGDEWLSPGERAVAVTLRWPKRRSDWRLGRWVAKRAVIACWTDEPDAIEPPDIEILAQHNGAPAARILARPAAMPVSVSISHSGGMGLAVAAVGPVALGCDVERIEPRSERFVRDYFTAAERERVTRTTVVDRAAVSTLIWSAKEAALKVLGTGMRLDTRAVDVKAPVAAPGRDSLRRSACEGRMPRMSGAGIGSAADSFDRRRRSFGDPHAGFQKQSPSRFARPLHLG
jgi:4'-phosphopantetheinyl transferase